MDFPFSLVAGHVLCEMDGKRVLVDTGSPFSLGREHTMRLLGAPTELAAAGPVPTIDSIAEEIRALSGAPADFDFDVLLGCDVLAGRTMELDWSRSLLSVEPATAGTVRPPAEDPVQRLPRIRVEVNGRVLRAFADTGAWVSYALADHVSGAAPAGRARDFLMGLGVFEARLVSTEVKLCGCAFDAVVAVAEGALEQVLRATRVDGIVGTDLMARCGRTRFVFGRAAERDDDVAAPLEPFVRGGDA